jgi:sucrose-6F-phosphate phosphohydrolase
MTRLLLCTDLDRTLLPNGPLPESPGARPTLARFVRRSPVILAYATGRDRRLVEQAIEEYAVPIPDFVIGDVGTTIFHVTDGRWRIDNRWSDQIGADWRGLSRAEIAKALAPIAELVEQEPEKQNTYKLSYYVSTNSDRADIDERARRTLKTLGVKANRIWSMDELAGTALLDVLPAAASKLHAVEFLRDSLGVATDEVLFAGDSGNDLAVLASGIPSVLVANALPEVSQKAVELASANGTEDRLYLAKGGFLNMNGNYAAGILEGISHFHPELADFGGHPSVETA